MQKQNEVQVLTNVIDAVSSLGIDELLIAVDEIISDLTTADSTGIYTLDQSSDSVILRASKIHFDCIGKLKMKRGEGITGWVAQKGIAVVIEKDAVKDPRFSRVAELPDDLYESFLSVPIQNGEVIMGVINIKHKNEHQYSPELVALVGLIGKLVGKAIERATLLEETQNLKEAIETQKSVNLAKNLLMKKLNISENEAFQLLRKQSMNKRISLLEVSQAVLTSESLLDNLT